MAHRLGQCVYIDWFMIPVNELAWGLFHIMETGIYERCCGVYIVESLYKTICHNTLFCTAWQWQVRNVFCGYFGVTYPYYEMVDCTNQRATRLLHSLCDLYTEITLGVMLGYSIPQEMPQCQWSKPDGYGKISQCITTTKHSKAKTVCIFLGIYCTCDLIRVAWQCGVKQFPYIYICIHILNLQLSNVHSNLTFPDSSTTERAMNTHYNSYPNQGWSVFRTHNWNLTNGVCPSFLMYTWSNREVHSFQWPNGSIGSFSISYLYDCVARKYRDIQRMLT